MNGKSLLLKTPHTVYKRWPYRQSIRDRGHGLLGKTSISRTWEKCYTHEITTAGDAFMRSAQVQEVAWKRDVLLVPTSI